MTVIEIQGVSLFESNSEQLWGCNLGVPEPNSQIDTYAIEIGGWALGRNSPAVAVELINEGARLRRIHVDMPRPDVAAAYPEVPGALNSGFRITVSALGITPEFELLVQAVLQDESRVPMGVVRGYRRSLYGCSQSRLQPLMVTSLGRSGSNWLMHLLGQHPQIVTYRPFEFEPRVGSYWMHILKSLSEPASYLRSLAADLSDEDWWLGYKPFLMELTTLEPQMQQWLGRDHIEELVAFCQNRIETFYEQVALVQGRTEPTYFAEKYSAASAYFAPNYVPVMMQELYPQAREIFLVRDFRDMFCSILAYNAKLGFDAFGRKHANNNEEYIQQLRLDALHLLRSWESRSMRAHLLRYEDLILCPVETLSALLKYLDFDPTPSLIESMIQKASEETLGMQVHRTSPDSEKSIGRWRRDLDPSLQAVCQEAFGDILEEFGYAE